MQKWIAVLFSFVLVLLAAVLFLMAAVFRLYQKDQDLSVSASTVQTISQSGPDGEILPSSGAESVPGPMEQAESAFSAASVPAEIHCSVEQGALRLVEGEAFGLSESGGQDCEVSWKDGVYFLSVHTTHQEPIILTVPQGTRLETLSLSVTGGDLSAEGLCTNALSVTCAQGTLHFSGQVEGSAQVDHQQGNTVLELSGSASDFNYELEYELGHIAIGSQSYAGAHGSQSIQNGSAKTIQIHCAMGNVGILFPEDS